MSTRSEETVVPPLAALVCLVGAGVFSGYALSVLWRWFAVPLGAPLIGVAQAVGLSVLWRLFAGARRNVDNRTTIQDIGFALGRPATCLLVGWIARMAQ